MRYKIKIKEMGQSTLSVLLFRHALILKNITTDHNSVGPQFVELGYPRERMVLPRSYPRIHLKTF